MRREGRLVCAKRRGADEDPTYADYYTFDAAVGRVRPHQVLAVRRGEAAKALSASVQIDVDRLVQAIVLRSTGLLREAVEDGIRRVLVPSVERDVRRELDESADEHAIGVFAINLKNLLRQPPLPSRRVLGVDPGFRTGCKLAAVDTDGRVTWTGVVFVHDGRKDDAPRVLREAVARLHIDVIAVGSGTASVEAQQAVAGAISGTSVRYGVVDEAGASVYSASELAREELPDLDVTLRGAVSIARRLQDPLAELVKIDPKSIGVGMYQHDVDPSRLERALDAVVEDAVNAVGVDLGSASKRLLTHVSGIGPVLADRIVAWRERSGFERRADLREVKGIGERTFQQCAGFLRIRGGPEPLDATAIHPESYPAARAILKAARASVGDPALAVALEGLRRSGDLSAIVARFDLGVYTLEDLLAALVRPGRDPREDVEPPALRDRQLTLDDLAVGARLVGTVRNVVDFGAFVDIGVKHEGLVHVSQMSDAFVRDPHAVVAVGDRVEVTVLSIDRDRSRISLSMKTRATPPASTPSPRR
jgi:uncharacterized protein